MIRRNSLLRSAAAPTLTDTSLGPHGSVTPHIPARSPAGTVAALALSLGLTAVAASWMILQLFTLAIILGMAGVLSTRAETVPGVYAAGSTVAATAAIGLGAAVCTRLLVARDVSARAARRVGHGQSLAVTVPVLLVGHVSNDPAPVAVALLLAGALIGSLLGVRAGAPWEGLEP
jgi:hypothetical protein